MVSSILNPKHYSFAWVDAACHPDFASSLDITSDKLPTIAVHPQPWTISKQFNGLKHRKPETLNIVNSEPTPNSLSQETLLTCTGRFEGESVLQIENGHPSVFQEQNSQLWVQNSPP